MLLKKSSWGSLRATHGTSEWVRKGEGNSQLINKTRVGVWGGGEGYSLDALTTPFLLWAPRGRKDWLKMPSPAHSVCSCATYLSQSDERGSEGYKQSVTPLVLASEEKGKRSQQIVREKKKTRETRICEYTQTHTQTRRERKSERTSRVFPMINHLHGALQLIISLLRLGLHDRSPENRKKKNKGKRKDNNA